MKKRLFLCFALVLTGCAANLSVVKRLNFIPGQKPLKVAVLPFNSKTVEGDEVKDQVRHEVTANLQEGNYDIIEISDIDQYLNEKNVQITSPNQMRMKNRQLNLKERFDADLVIQGRVIEWTKTYLAVHSDVELDVEIYVFDAASGKMIAKVRKGEIKNSGLSRIPTGYISAGTAPVLGLRKSVQQEVIHNLTREISKPLIELNQRKKIEI